MPEPPARGFGGWARDGAAWLTKGAISVPEAVVGLADIPTGGRVGKFLENEDGAIGFRPKQAKEMVNDWHSDATKEAQRKFQEAEGIGGKFQAAIENPSNVVGAVFESLPSMGAGSVVARGALAAAKAGYLGKAAAAGAETAKGALIAGGVGEGAVMAGSQAESIRQETEDGLLTPGQAGASLATGGIGGAFSFMGGRLANKLRIGDADTMMAQGTKGIAKQNADEAAAAAANPLAQQAAKGIPRQVVEGAISEGFLEELPQSMAETIIKNLALDKPWTEGLDEAIVMGVLSGGAMGGAAAGYKGMTAPKAQKDENPNAPAPTADAGAPAGPGTQRMRNAFAEQLAAERAAGTPAPVLNEDVMLQNGIAPQASINQDQIGKWLSEPQRPSEAMGLRADAGGLEGAAALAVDSGASPAVQPQQYIDPADLPDAGMDWQSPAMASTGQEINYDDLSPLEKELYDWEMTQQNAPDEAFASLAALDDSDIPFFDQASNVSDEDFLRAMGASDEEITNAIATSNQPRGAQGSAAGATQTQANDAGSTGARAGQGQSTGQVTKPTSQATKPPSQVNNPPSIGQQIAKLEAQADAADAEARDWASRTYKANGKDLPKYAAQGGPADVGEANEQRRLKAIADAKGRAAAARAEAQALRDQGNAQAQQAAKAPTATQAAPQAAPTPEPKAASVADLAAISRKQIPDMTDSELVQLANATVPSHSRYQKLQKAIQTRGLQSQEATKQGAKTDGTQTPQAQQASTQQPAAGAAAGQAVNRVPAATAAQAAGTAAKQGAVNGGTTTGNNGPQASQQGAAGSQEAIAAIAQEGNARREAERTRKLEASERWTRMTTAERQAVAAVAPGLNVIARKNLHTRAWADIGEKTRAKLLDSLLNPSAGIADKAPAAIKNEAKAAPAALSGQAQNMGDAKAFAPETGTLGIPRADMPQVPTASHGGLVKHLNAQGIAHETKAVDAADLKPTQAEYSPAKVAAAKSATGDRAVIVSSDGHIIDGHHQAVAAAEEGKQVKAIVLDAPVEKALEAVKASPSAQQEKSETDESEVVDGLRVSPSMVKLGDTVKPMWKAQSFENAEREKRGERQLGGDSLHDTKEQAIAAAKSQAQDAKDKARAEAEQAQQEKVEGDAAAAKKADTINGFTVGMAPNTAALAAKALDKLVRWRDKVASVREHIEAWHKAGELEVSISQEPRIKPLSRTAFNRASQREQDAHEKRMKDAGNKKVYWVNDIDLGKTAHDYASHLLAQDDQAQAPEQPPVQAERSEYPFGKLEAADTDEFHGLRVRVLPEMRGDSAWEGEVGMVLKHGRLLEVLRDGRDLRVRVPGDRVEVIDPKAIATTPAARFEQLRTRGKAEYRANDREQAPFKAFGTVAGATGESYTTVWSRWNSVMGFMETVKSGTGDEVAAKMQAQLLKEPWANEAVYPGDGRGMAADASLQAWRNRADKVDKQAESFARELDSEELRARDAENFGVQDDAVSKARAAVAEMRKRAAKAVQETKDGLAKAEERAKAEEAAEAKAYQDTFEVPSQSVLAKKPTPASISNWSNPTELRGQKLYSNGHIVDATGTAPHLKGWETRIGIRKDISPDQMDRVLGLAGVRNGAPDSSYVKAEPFALIDDKKNGRLFFDVDGKLVGIDLTYAQYFNSKVKGATFMVNPNDLDAAVRVMDGDKLAGILMPIRQSIYSQDKLTVEAIRGYMAASGKDKPQSIVARKQAEKAKELAAEQPAAAGDNSTGVVETRPAQTKEFDDNLGYDNALMAGTISVEDYMKAMGLSDDDVGTLDSKGLRAQAEQQARLSSPYIALVNRMHVALSEMMRQALDAAANTPEKRKSKEERIARINRDRDLVEMLARKFEHPFKNNYVSKLSPILKTRFGKQFDEVDTGHVAQTAFRDDSYRRWAEKLVEVARTKRGNGKTTSTAGKQTDQQAMAVGDDFPMAEAINSYSGISHSGRSRAEGDKQAFDKFMKGAEAAGDALAETDAQREAMSAAVEQLRADYLAQYRKLMNVRAGTYSGYVAGRGNLNSNQANSRNNALDKAMQQFDGWVGDNVDRISKAVLDARTPEQVQADRDKVAAEIEAKLAKKISDLKAQLLKFLSFKSGEEMPYGKSAVITRVSYDKDGYPSSLNFKMADGSPVTDDKLDLVSTLKDKDETTAQAKARIRTLVDEVRAENPELTKGAGAIRASASSKAAQNKEMVAKVSADYLNGAVKGDTITASADFDYVSGGKPMVIEDISPKGEVHVVDPVRGGRTSFSASLAAARRITFEVKKAEPEQEPQSYLDRHNAIEDGISAGTLELADYKAAFADLEANQAQVIAELQKMTKEKLLRAGGPAFAYRMHDEKKDAIVQAAYSKMLDTYALGRSYGPSSYFLSAAGIAKNKADKAQALRDMVANTTAEDLAARAAEIKAARDEYKAEREAKAQALANPKSLQDFRGFMRHWVDNGDTAESAYLRLTPEQRQNYDALEAEQTKDSREAAKRRAKVSVASAGNTTAGEVIATKHTKHGHDLFVVQLADRVERDAYETLNNSAKRLGGSYSSYRGGGAVPGFQFRNREAAEAFQKLVSGDTAQAQQLAEQRRDAFDDDKSQTAAERLRTMADALDERATEALDADRKVNTARRARFAASADAAARAQKALAGTMRNIAKAIDSGAAKFLDGVRQRVQVEYLMGQLRTAKSNQLQAKYPDYGERMKRQGEPMDAETVDFAQFPRFEMFRSDLASLARQLLEIDGGKKMGAALEKLADDVSEAYIAWAKENLLRVSQFGNKVDGGFAEFASKDVADRAIKRAGLVGKAVVLPIKRGQNRVILSPGEAMQRGLWQGDGDKRIRLSMEFVEQLAQLGKRKGSKVLALPWQLESALENRQRLQRMGIQTSAEFRSALRELASLQQEMATPDRIKELERSMVGRANDGLDFFPTSPAVVQSMLDAAEISEGMAVLEPSAGMGHIADAIVAETGVWPDVVEISGQRRELLEAKGFHLAEVNDFMELKPREFFTFGDTFRAPDGTEGVMRGQGGMGSQRVRLVAKDGNYSYFDRDQLVGVAQNGVNAGYDRIVMNPPFSDGRDIQHVQHAYNLLKPGGRIVAIMGEGAFFQSNKRAEAFRDWLDERGATNEKLPDGSFMDPSLPVNTGVAARMVVIDKPVGDLQLAPRYGEDAANYPDSDQGTDSGDVRFSRVTKARGQSMAAAQVQQVVDAMRAAWANPPEVVVAFDMQDPAIPAEVRAADLRQRSGGAVGEPEGFYYKGKVYVLASQMRTANDVARVVAHEVLGHYGLRGMFGKHLGSILDQLATMRRAEVAAKIKEYGLSDDAKGRREAAEEVLSVMAQTTPKLGFVTRAVAAIRTWLRANVPGFQSLRVSDAEIIRDYILPARAWVERGGPDGNGPRGGQRIEPVMSRAEAGSTTDQTQTANFKRWYGDWQNAGQGAASNDSTNLDARGNQDIDPLQRHRGVGANPDGATRVGDFTFPGASGPVGRDGAPARFFHGTRDDFTTFDGRAATRKDNGWLGAGFYFTSNADDAAYYSGAKAGVVGRNVMPVYVAVRNPYVATPAEKAEQKSWSRERLQQRTQELQAQGYDGVVMAAEDGTIELVAFQDTQIKSAIGNNGDFDPANPDIRFSRAKMAELKDKGLQMAHTYMTHPGKVSLWDKTVGTMRHISERYPAFKPVFEAAQQFIDDVASVANQAAQYAPRLIPRVETLSDLRKKPISVVDNRAIGKALFGGTLDWGRDQHGKAMLLDELKAKYAGLTVDQKAEVLLAAGKVRPQLMAAMRGKQLEQFESFINNRFDSTILKPGARFNHKELREFFDLNDQQISLYDEARATVDKSLDMTARAEMLRALGRDWDGFRDMVMDAPTLTDAWKLLDDELEQRAKAIPDSRDQMAAKMFQIRASHDKAQELMQHGYMPLQRFGKYTVDVVGADGERIYFGMFESKADSNRMAETMKRDYQDASVTQGTLNDQQYKLFAGITPETAELFGTMLGLDAAGNDAKDQAFQEFLKLSKNNHSALKRLIHRKGIAGYSEDVGRVLASFVYSNARLAATGLNAGKMENAINDLNTKHKQEGELGEIAAKLREYIQDPQEEGQAIRGMLFAQYLGGSIASAMVNMTQPFAVTLPWLSQFGGMAKASRYLSGALKDMATRGFKYDSELAHALKMAEDDGVVSPQEIHQLMAQARGAGGLRTGDGTKTGDARANAANVWEKVKVGWGQPFALAEQFNRRSTFIAAYRLAKEQGKDNPAEFARRAVVETQFLYTKANKPQWARGAVGGTLFTFKTYSVSFLELMQRTWNAGEAGSPERAAGRRAVGWAMLMLMLMGGAGGLPFVEDVEDLVDGAGQMMGYNTSVKQWRQQAMRDVLGSELADFLESGLSGLPGMPLDVSGRLGMGNLIPGTGLLLDKQSNARDVVELLGPAGDLVQRGLQGTKEIIKGAINADGAQMVRGAGQWAPNAVRNLAKGADMAVSGMYKDSKGYKVIDTTLDEAILKAIGFQPRSVAEVQESNSFMQRSKSFYIQTSSDIKAKWAQALFDKDAAGVERARERVQEWNRKNPDQPIRINMPDIWKRVAQMGKDRTDRIADTAPKALRQQLRDMAQEQSR